jgi:hypothetical protein
MDDLDGHERTAAGPLGQVRDEVEHIRTELRDVQAMLASAIARLLQAFEQTSQAGHDLRRCVARIVEATGAVAAVAPGLLDQLAADGRRLDAATWTAVEALQVEDLVRQMLAGADDRIARVGELLRELPASGRAGAPALPAGDSCRSGP